jgi:hypothetical protein
VLGVALYPLASLLDSVAFVLTRRSILAGVLCGEIVMLAGKGWLG